jgi:hypothetical protein
VVIVLCTYLLFTLSKFIVNWNSDLLKFSIWSSIFWFAQLNPFKPKLIANQFLFLKRWWNWIKDQSEKHKQNRWKILMS